MYDFISTSLNEDPRQPLSHTIANHIAKKIFIGELPHGTRLIESDIAKELNVSNIPVREAFYILESTGIIQRLPRKGVHVKSISEREMNDYTTALIELFSIGVNYSTDKWNEEKHQNLKRYFTEAEEALKEKSIIDYVLKCYYTCRYIFEVAENEAFLKFHTQITYITNAYCQTKWSIDGNLKIRHFHLESAVNAIINSQFEQAKEELEKLAKQSLTI